MRKRENLIKEDSEIHGLGEKIMMCVNYPNLICSEYYCTDGKCKYRKEMIKI